MSSFKNQTSFFLKVEESEVSTPHLKSFRPKYGGKYWLGRDSEGQIYAIYFGMSEGSHIFMRASTRGVKVFRLEVLENGGCPRRYFVESGLETVNEVQRIGLTDFSFLEKLDPLEGNFALRLIDKYMSKYGDDAVENSQERDLVLKNISAAAEQKRKTI